MSQQVTTQNPFNAPATQQQVNAPAHAESQRAIAEVQAALTVAKAYPRNQREALDRILNACTRKTLAEGALYSYSKGGTEVTGPSIRLAEAIAQGWGNIQFGIRELEQVAGKESVVEAFAWDIETNTRQVKTFTVPHKRFTRQGAKTLTDSRDIYELVANQGARRLRACILGVIPGDVVEAAQEQCETTLHASADTSPEAIKIMLAKFMELGVDQSQIEKRIQCNAAAIRPAQVIQLRKIHNSIRDGMSKPADWFESDSPVSTSINAGKAESNNPHETNQGQ